MPLNQLLVAEFDSFLRRFDHFADSTVCKIELNWELLNNRCRISINAVYMIHVDGGLSFRRVTLQFDNLVSFSWPHDWCGAVNGGCLELHDFGSSKLLLLGEGVFDKESPYPAIEDRETFYRRTGAADMFIKSRSILYEVSDAPWSHKYNVRRFQDQEHVTVLRYAPPRYRPSDSATVEKMRIVEQPEEDEFGVYVPGTVLYGLRFPDNSMAEVPVKYLIAK